MELTSLSWMPFRPSLLFKYPNATILLDCAVDMEALGYFLPYSIVNKSSYAWLETAKHIQAQARNPLKLAEGFTRVGEYVFVDGVPEVHPVSLHNFSADSIDVILVSNWMSLLALPFITEKSTFNGSIFATGPTVQMGRLVAEEFLDMVERVDRDTSPALWKDKSKWINSRGKASINPADWRRMYTRDDLNRCIERIRNVYFRESICINGALTVSAASSGFSIGSCNWIIETDSERIGYMSATSSRSSHVKPVDLEPFRKLDTLIFTSLARAPEASPESIVHKFSSIVIDTLRKAGNVLIPVAPTGTVYDLFELVYAAMENHGISRDICMYFISSAAESTLAYSNIYSEWLSAEKSSKAYIPEEPFIHSDLIKCGRLKVYDNLYGAFSREFRPPCVMFIGHPSLRVGEVVHFLDAWGNDPRNCIILTDPDYSMDPFYNPYKALSIRAYHCPIDTRLDYTQVSTNILIDLQPRLLMLPECYSKPIKVQDKTYSIEYGTQKTFDQYVRTQLPCQKKRKRVLIDPDVLKSIKIVRHAQNNEIGICPINGMLSAYNNKLKILPADNSTVKQRKRLFGQVTVEKLQKYLELKDLNVEVIDQTDEANFIIKINTFNAKITVSDDGTRSRIDCMRPTQRTVLHNAIRSCLQEL